MMLSFYEELLALFQEKYNTLKRNDVHHGITDFDISIEAKEFATYD